MPPDVTPIEGVEGTIHGHCPATSLANECVKPFRVLVGSRNVVAADLVGDMPEGGSYPSDLIDRLPDDIRLVRGTQRACKEGCATNPVSGIQVFHADHGGKGGFALVFGKGHGTQAIDAIQGRALVVGPCAVEEVSDRLIERLGRRNVYLSRHCNDLCAITEALFHLMKVTPIELTYLGPIRSLYPYLVAPLKRSSSRVPHLLSHVIKRV